MTRRPKSIIILVLTVFVLATLFYVSSSTSVLSIFKRNKNTSGFDGGCVSLALELSNTQCYLPEKLPLKKTQALGLICGARGTLRKPQPLYHGLGLNCSAVTVEGCYRGCYAQNENAGPEVCHSWSYDRENQWCEFYGATLRKQGFKVNDQDQTRRWFDRDCFEAECSQDGI